VARFAAKTLTSVAEAARIRLALAELRLGMSDAAT
jgi:hypothetical protein